MSKVDIDNLLAFFKELNSVEAAANEGSDEPYDGINDEPYSFHLSAFEKRERALELAIKVKSTHLLSGILAEADIIHSWLVR